MGLLLQGSPAPRFLDSAASSKAGAKIQNLGYSGGTISGPVGTLDYFFDLSDGTADYCNSPSITVSRGGHSRVRVIGQPATSVSGVSYSLKQFPFVDDQTGQAGKEMEIIDPSTGDSWTLRRRGAMQDLVSAICSGELEAARSFYIRSSRGRTYGPFLPPGQSQP